MESVDASYLPCSVVAVETAKEAEVLVLVAESVAEGAKLLPSTLAAALNAYAALVKATAEKGAHLICLPAGSGPLKVLVFANCGDLQADFADLRLVAAGAAAGVKLALTTGFRKLALATAPTERFPTAELVGALGALEALYVPLEVRSVYPEKRQKADRLELLTKDPGLLRQACGIEVGRCVARDISGGDPEAMAPPAAADYVRQAFHGPDSPVTVKVIDDQELIRKEYPCMHAVNRAANVVPRHQARLIYLEYNAPGGKAPEETLCFVGKGVTLDTGGLDVKTDGHMFGMSRDKSGAGGVGGFFKSLEAFRPPGIKVMGYMCMVRNSVGPESYSCDEKIRARSGKRVLVVNTDAEGRMAMLDPLCHMKEMALKEVNPHLFTVATLTGHAVLSIGEYAMALDNGPAWRRLKASRKLADVSETVADMVEVSRLRQEDFEAHAGKTEYEDVVQGGAKASSVTIRGHQGPAAFLNMGSGLVDHSSNSAHPLPYTHIDMAGREGDFPGIPTGAPVAALTARYVFPKL